MILYRYCAGTAMILGGHIMAGIIPQPKNITAGSGKVAPGKIVSNDGFSAVRAYEEYRERLALKEGGTPVVCVRGPELAPGAYCIECSGNITLKASDEKGMHHALATLLQLEAAADMAGFDAVNVYDAPDYFYRGVMIDTARIFHPLSNLMRYVDLCWLYKLTHLHIHFTDDQSYTLPSDVFPELPTEGRSYSKTEIGTLCAYAESRGVKIMPEIDIPGHCSSFAKAYPEIFTSGENRNIIAFAPRVFSAFEKLFAELAVMFPGSDRIHIGGDEANIGSWLKSDECLAYAEECGVPADGNRRLSAERIYAMFVKKLSDIVLSLGKIPVCWEGFCKEVNYIVPRTTEIFSWEMFYQLTPDLIAGGYTIINGSWLPNYIVWPGHQRPVEELFNWSPRSFQAVHPNSPYRDEPYLAPQYDRLIGGQLLSWGDYGVKASDPAAHLAGEFAAVSERIPATAEGVWNREKKIGFEEFEQNCRIISQIVDKI